MTVGMDGRSGKIRSRKSGGILLSKFFPSASQMSSTEVNNEKEAHWNVAGWAHHCLTLPTRPTTGLYGL